MRDAFVRPTDTKFDAYPFTFFPPRMPFVFRFFFFAERIANVRCHFFKSLMECGMIVVSHHANMCNVHCALTKERQCARNRNDSIKNKKKHCRSAKEMCRLHESSWSSQCTINVNDVIVTSTRTTRWMRAGWDERDLRDFRDRRSLCSKWQSINGIKTWLTTDRYKLLEVSHFLCSQRICCKHWPLSASWWHPYFFFFLLVILHPKLTKAKYFN